MTMGKDKVKIAGLLLAILVVTLPWWAPNTYWLHVVTLIAIYWIINSGLNLVVGYTGVLSVGHVGFFATGAYAAAILCEKAGISPWLALPCAGIAAGFLAAFISLPSLRLQLFYFAMCTLAFSTVVNRLTYGISSLTGGGTGLPGPSFSGFFGTENGFYLLIVFLAGFFSWICWNISRHHPGRALIAIRDSQEAAEALAIPVLYLKVIVFTFSGVLAGVAGALYASHQTYITPEAFTFYLSLFFFVSILIGGRGNYLGPFLGTAILALLPEISGPLAKLSQFFYGLLLLLVILFVPRGISSAFDRRRRQAEGRMIPPKAEILCEQINPDKGSLVSALSPGAAKAVSPPVLKADNLFKKFGNLVAVDNASLEVPPGTIHGMIGPNGSGKTTILNLLLGYYPLDGGAIYLNGQNYTQRSTRERVIAGLSRTFQTPKVLGELTVIENVMLGFGRQEGQGFFKSALPFGSVQNSEKKMRREALQLLEAFGMAHMALQRADTLQHSEERFLEIARALAQRPKFILMDEPAGGLSIEEIEILGRILVEIRKSQIGILLVEHHSDFVFQVSDVVTTLDFGKVIAQGRPEVVQADEKVKNAYLGS
ncbi:MAG: ATP-binding cassette domain-containing protein [Deltaproteobacteria bacterium]|nr:MAG: ATP-binding cassette domain-containing protein [Deltaproteobacteria bacterium]